MTLSIGVGEGTEDLIELGELSQSGLDLALGRGDQVAIKNMNGNVRFTEVRLTRWKNEHVLEHVLSLTH